MWDREKAKDVGGDKEGERRRERRESGEGTEEKEEEDCQRPHLNNADADLWIRNVRYLGGCGKLWRVCGGEGSHPSPSHPSS